MVHTRMNERMVNPNSQINFICALPSPGSAYGSGEDDEAREVLRALAAQLKPVMRRHGFTVNSFEEYESNKVFLGRNWNNGETIELVLRDGSGRFYPASRLLGVFCHELAHIEHMDHSSAFHLLRRQLSSEVAALQRQGYYGDGYWSAGTRLSDSLRISGKGVSAQELPEYTCGGAHAQSRSSALPSRRRRHPRRPAGPSLSSGVQSTKQRKAGSRVTSKIAFEAAGEGRALDERVEKGGEGSGFRKQARSQRAREERALAAERRLLMMQGGIQDLPEKTDSETDDENKESPGYVETDGDRLKRMQDVMGPDDLEAMRDDAYDDIVVVSEAGTASTGSFRSTSQSAREDAPLSDEDSLASAQITRNIKRGPTESRGCDDAPRKKQRREGQSASDKSATSRSGTVAASSSLHPPSGSSILREEVRQRKREALGMDRPRILGNSKPTSKAGDGEWTCDMCTFVNASGHRACMMCGRLRRDGRPGVEQKWTCSTCTYDNGGADSKCAMCEHAKA